MKKCTIMNANLTASRVTKVPNLASSSTAAKRLVCSNTGVSSFASNTSMRTVAVVAATVHRKKFCLLQVRAAIFLTLCYMTSTYLSNCLLIPKKQKHC